eukprot:9116300-Heterocapsa_arctica.AAC.1
MILEHVRARPAHQPRPPGLRLTLAVAQTVCTRKSAHPPASKSGRAGWALRRSQAVRQPSSVGRG